DVLGASRHEGGSGFRIWAKCRHHVLQPDHLLSCRVNSQIDALQGQATEESATEPCTEIDNGLARCRVSADDRSSSDGPEVGYPAPGVNAQQAAKTLSIPTTSVWPEQRRSAEQFLECC